MIPTLHVLCSGTCRIFTLLVGTVHWTCLVHNFQHLLFSTGPTNPGVYCGSDRKQWIGIRWDLYHLCQKQHFHERVKHHILCSSITFHDLFKTYDIYNYNQHKDSKTWLIQHAPPHPFLHHECLTQNRIRHMKKPCRMLLRPFVGDTGEGVLHVQPGIKVGYQPTLRKKTNTCIVVLFWENSKTRYIEHLVLKWEWIEIHILSMLLSMLGVWCSRNGWHFRSYKLPRERLIDGQEAFIGDFQDLNQS